MNSHLLADLGKAIIGAGVVSIPAYFIGIPLILAYLIAGMILGPHLGFSIIQDAQSIATLSEIGLVLLMFILGLEINLQKLLQSGKAVILSSLVQVVGTILLSFLILNLLPLSLEKHDQLYIAIACALSSTLIVVKILSDKMDLDSLPSRITLGILVVQDFVAIGFMALQPNLSHLNILSLGISLSKVGVLVFISWCLAKYILPTVFRKSSRNPELLLILAMSWCFGMCGIADYLGLSLEMGGLVAGISIASFPYHLDVAAKISSLRDFFITLFFVGLGLQIPMPTVEVLQLTAVMVTVVLVSRILTIFPVLHRLGYANRASLLPAINLSQLSEFSLVLASLGVAYQHISPHLFSVFILALVISALISSVMIPQAHAIYKSINSILEKIGFLDQVPTARNSLSDQTTPPSTIIILGFFREASSLLFEMQNKYSEEYLKQVLVVDFNPEAHQELKQRNINCQYGDISNVDTLRSLNLNLAKMIICSIPDKILKGTSNLKMLRLLKPMAPQARIIVTAENINYAQELYDHGADFVFIPRVIGATYLLEILERLQMEGSSALRLEANELLSERKEILP